MIKFKKSEKVVELPWRGVFQKWELSLTCYRLDTQPKCSADEWCWLGCWCYLSTKTPTGANFFFVYVVEHSLKVSTSTSSVEAKENQIMNINIITNQCLANPTPWVTYLHVIREGIGPHIVRLMAHWWYILWLIIPWWGTKTIELTLLGWSRSPPSKSWWS